MTDSNLARAGLRTAFNTALDAFRSADAYLLQNTASERALCHRLAAHLAVAFPDYDVDCEYNLDGAGRKKLYRATRKRRCPVYPDIVVHRRGSRTNLLAIEVKKGRSRTVGKFDEEKLQGYRDYYGYQEVVFLELPVGHHADTAPYLDWRE
jgi:hypothetical protein